ncbi:MAG: hypothetical protein IJ482_04740 [Alphaproteobacteria bacterium]|nr:hypothetical protein [Alphaproteobacteria bacterium]
MMNYKYILAAGAAILIPLTVQAETCGTLPSCATIGFDKTADDCAGRSKLKCPFGDAYFCSETCEELGYSNTSSHGCLVGQTQEICPADSNYYKCTGDATVIATDSCASGFLQTDTDACGDCAYGIISNGTTSTQGNTCYRCGTQSECGCYTPDNGLSVPCKCLMCAVTAAVQ